MLHKSKWYLLIVLLLLLVLFSVLAIPKIAVYTLERTRGEIVTVADNAN